MDKWNQPQVPLCLSKESRKTRVNKEDDEKDKVDNSEAGEELGEGGDNIVASED